MLQYLIQRLKRDVGGTFYKSESVDSPEAGVGTSGVSGAIVKPEPTPVTLPSLTGLRGVAALIVTIAHYASSGGSLGQIGVQLFFLLSAYLMCLLYLEAPRGETFLSRARFALIFMHNRAARVLPLAFIVVAISAVAKLIPNKHYYAVFRINYPFWEYLFLRQAPGIMWTIAVEFGFYIFFALILLLPPRVARATMGMVTVMSVVSFVYPPPISFEEATGIRWGLLTFKAGLVKFFALGSLCYEVHRFLGSRNLRLNALEFSGKFIHACGSIVYIGMFMYHTLWWHFSRRMNYWNSGWDPVWLCFMFLGTLYLQPIQTLLSYRISLHIGKISYSLYLTHLFLFVHFSRSSLTKATPLQTVSFIFAAIIFASASYYAIELPTNRLFRRRGASSAIPNWATHSSQPQLPLTFTSAASTPSLSPVSGMKSKDSAPSQ